MAGFELTQAIVRELLDYNPETGRLTWRRRARKYFKSDMSWRMWNSRYAGTRALACVDHKGYLRGDIFGKKYYAHRIIWLHQIGNWPDPEVDHKNQNGSDNRWENLCEATHQKNARNQRLVRTNTTGYVGVSLRKTRTLGVRYRVHIKMNGKTSWLGTYDTKEQAVAARMAASEKHGFSDNHGSTLLSAAERG